VWSSTGLASSFAIDIEVDDDNDPTAGEEENACDVCGEDTSVHFFCCSPTEIFEIELEVLVCRSACEIADLKSMGATLDATGAHGRPFDVQGCESNACLVPRLPPGVDGSDPCAVTFPARQSCRLGVEDKRLSLNDPCTNRPIGESYNAPPAGDDPRVVADDAVVNFDFPFTTVQSGSGSSSMSKIKSLG
jgi:hypothetical protein